jgi:GR25 family glycosyltransferase involved in LPS biosynthesis
MIFLLASLLLHLKPIPDKTEGHSIRNIDFIYMINLDERPEKFERSLQELYLYGITPYRFSAINGWNLTLEEINDLGLKLLPGMDLNMWGTRYRPKEPHEKYFDEVPVPCTNPTCPCAGPIMWQHEPLQHYGVTYFSHCSSRGMIGIALSHLSILHDALDSGYETIWVMEDDIQVIRNPHLLSDLIDKLDALLGKDGWDVLFTDRDIKNDKGEYVPCNYYARRPNFSPPDPYKFDKKYDISPDFRYVGSRYGAHSMILRRSGIEKILNFIKQYQIFLPYDIDYSLPPGMRFYTVREDVVSTLPHNLSDNGLPKFLKVHKEEFK